MPVWLWVTLLVGFDLLLAWALIRREQAGTDDRFLSLIPRRRRSTGAARIVTDAEEPAPPPV
jgi:hypothetical protein